MSDREPSVQEAWEAEVKRLFRMQGSKPISNGLAVNARFLLQQILLHGEGEFLLTSTRLCHKHGSSDENDQVYDWPPLVEALKAYVSREGNSVRILTLDSPHSSKFLDVITNSDNCELRTMPESFQFRDGDDLNWLDFAVCGRAYRVELPTDNDDPDSVKAFACAKDDRDFVPKMERSFEALWKKTKLSAS